MTYRPAVLTAVGCISELQDEFLQVAVHNGPQFESNQESPWLQTGIPWRVLDTDRGWASTTEILNQWVRGAAKTLGF